MAGGERDTKADAVIVMVTCTVYVSRISLWAVQVALSLNNT